MPNLTLEGTFLGSSAADNVLAQTDLGLDRNLASNANLLGTSKAGWYIEDTTTDDSVRIMDFVSNETVPNATGVTYAEAGDTNARVRAQILPAASIHVSG